MNGVEELAEGVEEGVSEYEEQGKTVVLVAVNGESRGHSVLPLCVYVCTKWR